jgi:3-isopropylmalate/(R)-2-methylmalate dehydratase small subunit
MLVMRGKTWKFGDSINTDLIIPSQYCWDPPDELRKHAMEPVNPRFASQVQEGDVMVAGKNFGCGSSREAAPIAIKYAGVSAVVAESFSRIFFRNAIAIGLPVIECSDIALYSEEGDMLEIDIEGAVVRNITRNKTLTAKPLPAEMLEVLFKGGIIPILKEIAKQNE